MHILLPFLPTLNSCDKTGSEGFLIVFSSHTVSCKSCKTDIWSEGHFRHDSILPAMRTTPSVVCFCFLNMKKSKVTIATTATPFFQCLSPIIFWYYLIFRVKVPVFLLFNEKIQIIKFLPKNFFHFFWPILTKLI